MKNLLILFLIMTFSFCQVGAQNYKSVKEPDWVKMVDFPAIRTFEKADLDLGYYLTLFDNQINLDDNSIFNHVVINVVSYSGITKASQILVAYDTSFQQLKIHHLYIWRKGVKIDRTKELDFKALNNEYNLNNGIYTGLISAYCNLDDIRKDDLIDFSYTITGLNPIFKNEKYLFLPLENTNPIDLFFTRILYSNQNKYDFKCVNCDSSLKIEDTIIGKYRQLEITCRDLEALEIEGSLPSWVIPFKYFTLSSFKTWKEVNYWAQKVFSFGIEPDLEIVFKEIFTGNETRDEKINKIINFVQDDIRYMGIESGIGSIKPFPPDQVVKQRFGDCKDKSLLLVALLRKVGIKEAYPALVNTSMKHKIDELYPSNQVFDHCIVRFDLDNISYWMDPTVTQQGGDYKSMSIENYGKAMVVGIPSDSFQLMSSIINNDSIFISDEYNITSFSDPATLNITAIRKGGEADKRRLMAERVTAEDFTKALMEDLKKYYPTVTKISNVKYKDDVDNNIFTAEYKFKIDGYWQDGDKLGNENLADQWVFRFDPQTIYDYINKSNFTKRKFDLALLYPLNLKYQVVFNFPKDMVIYDKYNKYENEAFFFDQRIDQLSSNSFMINYNLATKSSIIKAADFEKIFKEINTIVDKLPIVIYFNKK